MDNPSHQPILNVYVIWHPDAEARCQPLAAALYASLYQDPQKPFARGIGIPTYFRCVCENDKKTPLAIDLAAAEHTVIVVLIEEHLVYDEYWAIYIAELYKESLNKSSIPNLTDRFHIF